MNAIRRSVQAAALLVLSATFACECFGDPPKRETLSLENLKVTLDRPADWIKTVRNDKTGTEIRLTKDTDAKYSCVTIIKSRDPFDEVLKFFSKSPPNGKSLANKPFKTSAGASGTHLTFSRPVSAKDKDILIDDMYFLPTADGKAVMIEGLFLEADWSKVQSNVYALATSVAIK